MFRVVSTYQHLGVVPPTKCAVLTICSSNVERFLQYIVLHHDRNR
uniref:Uncharacterized protein n=1 Tax=Arundo donax TaxID=35708 RepID=A0A0A9HFH6_ARUDO